ncbi:hypothetical protein N9059_01770 [bacterium]|nr:hypothetical protein [bacterium]
MWLNWLSYLIIVGLLVWHLVRIVRVWPVTHRIAVTSALLVLSMSLILIGSFTGLRWLLGIAGILMLIAVFWKFLGPGRILDQCEDFLVLGGIPHAETEKILDEQEVVKAQEIEKKERKRLFESDREAWGEAFSVEARSTGIAFEAHFEETVSLATEDGHPLRIGPGAVDLVLDDWGHEVLGSNDYFNISLRLTVIDGNGEQWVSRYSVQIENLVGLGFSEESRRSPADLEGWTQINPDHERAFRTGCLISKAKYFTDSRDQFSVRIGIHEYAIRLKHKGGFIDLAWEPYSRRFLLRLAGIYFESRDGEDDVELGDYPAVPAPLWGLDEIEPVVFPLLPEELLPFGKNATARPWSLDSPKSQWPPPFVRKGAEA